MNQDIREFIHEKNGKPVLTWDADLKPVPLHRARVVVTGRRSWAYRVKADDEFRLELQTRWMADLKRKGLPLQGELAVVFRFRGAKGIRPDITNLMKAIEDAGNGQLWVDDSQIVVAVGVIEEWGNGSNLVGLEVWPVE